jgi:hypothetical protein
MMKRIIVMSVLMVLYYSVSFTQDQLENPGFEEWEVISATPSDTIREPAQWSSLKTSDSASLSAFAPVVCTRSSDAHSGDYSVKLTNFSTFGIVANGIVTNGRIHPNLNTELAYVYTDTTDENWLTSFTSRPDSISGWFRYLPQGSDTLQVKVTLHQGYGKQPDTDFESKWIGMAEFKAGVNTADEWHRFSAPFTYFSGEDPEFALVVITSGNAYSAVAGSIAYLDDLEMIYHATSAGQRPERPDGRIAVTGLRTLWLINMNPGDFSQIRLFNITGKLVWNSRLDSERISIEEANLPQGIYVVTLTGPRKVFTQKIMLR